MDQQHHNQHEDERQQKCKQIKSELKQMEKELNNIKNDLENARSKGGDTGPIYAALDKLERQITNKTKERQEYCPPEVTEPKKPVLRDNQIIIGTSSVRRKVPADFTKPEIKKIDTKSELNEHN